MTSIRPLAREDLPEVVSLYERVMRSGSRDAPAGLVPYFERTFLDHPWADPDLPSLVSRSQEGRIIGFLGSHVRRIRFEERSMRLACGGQLIADPDVRNRAVGVFLLRTFLSGPQDVTITDGATRTVRQIWEGLGGVTSDLKSISWVRLLRPSRFAGDYLLRRRDRERAFARLRPLLDAVDALALRLPIRSLRPEIPAGSEEPLSAGALLENLPAVTASLRCYPEYDEPFLEWLFREMAAAQSRGTLRRLLVRDRRRQVIGWYVYYLGSEDECQVMQIAARHGNLERVLDQLFSRAYQDGAISIRGRLEPGLVQPLSARRCLFRDSGVPALVHARNPDVAAAVQSSRCLLTRMDGEWWMGHNLEPFT